MNREPHSKYEHGIKKFEVRIYWDDQTEVLRKTLPDSILRELEQYVIDLEDLRAQDPDNYFGEAAEYAQLQMLADDLIAKYKHEIVKDRDWWHGTDEYSFNIHSMEDDNENCDWYNVNVYKVDPVTGMDNYEWMIDLPRVFIKGEQA